MASLRIQRRALRDRIAELERVEQALARLLERRLGSGQWAWELVAAASATVQQGLSKKGAEMDTYYTPEQMKQFEEAGRRISPQERRAVEAGWTALLADLHAQPDLDPASPAAKELLERWDRLTAATMRGFEGFPELVEAIGENYRQGRFVGVEGAPQPADFAFIERARQAWGQGGGG